MNKSLLIAAAVATVASGASAQRISEKAVTNYVAPAAQNLRALPVGHEVAEMATPAQRKAFAQKAKKAAAQVNAFYRRPAGAFYFQMNKEFNGYIMPFLQTHPFMVNTFTNMSTSNADLTYNWQVQLYDRSAKARKWYSAASKDIQVTYNYEVDSVPMLTAKAGAVSDTYTIKGYKMDISTGVATKEAQAEVLSMPVNTEAFGSLEHPLLAMSHYAGSSDRRGTSKYGWSYYTGCNGPDGPKSGYWFGRNEYTDSKGNVNPFNLVAAAFEKPEHPYVLNKVYGRVGQVKLKSGANVTLTAKVYKLDEIKQYGDSSLVGYNTEECAKLEDNLIASGTCTLNAAALSDESAMLEFPLQTEVEGIPMEIAPEINSPILVVITGYNDAAVNSLTFTITSDKEDEGFGELAYIGHATGSVPTNIYGLNNFFTSGAMKVGMSIMLDVETPFIVYNYSNETGEVNFPAAGGSKSVEIYSYKNSEDWNTTLVDGSDVPDWLHISYVDGTGDSEGLVTATVKADAYPAGQKGGRRADVSFGFPGAHLTYIVRQNDQSGVDEVTVSGVQAYAANGNLYVNVKGAENAGELNVYNVAGKLVKTAVLSEGINILDAQDLAKGVYMLQFGNNTVKVVK